MIGSEADDRIRISTVGRGGSGVKVHGGFLEGHGRRRRFSVADEGIDRVVVLGGEGDDRVRVRSNVRLRVDVHGGRGDDRIKLGSVASIASGDEGDDTIIGGKARDILIGGFGRDRLVGRRGDDILIGGFGLDRLAGRGGHDILIGGATVYDPDADNRMGGFDMDLLAIMAEWNGGDDFDTRVGHLDGTIPGGANGSAVFTAATIIDDFLADRLTASSGTDWLVVNA